MGKMKQNLSIVFWFFVSLALVLAPARAEQRVALVIGNAAYGKIPKLSNPANDAPDMANALRNLGFDVILRADADKGGFDRALAEFSRKAAGADAVLFYYAGHGIQYKKQNYFLPVDVEVEDYNDVEFQAIGMERVLQAMERTRGVRILVLDACRDNPLDRKLAATTRAVGEQTRGLARVDRTEGLVVAYATAPDQVAQDGNGRNSPFTASLLRRLGEPGLEIATLFRRVAQDVFEKTNGQQRPEISVSLLNDYYLNLAESDSIAWGRVRESREPKDFIDFMAKYPASPFAREARFRLDLFERIRRENEERLARERESETVAKEQALRAALEEERRRLSEQRLLIEKQETEAREARRIEAERREVAARREAARLEAARKEAERLAAQAREAARVEAERKEAAAQLEAERREAQRQAALKVEAERKEAEGLAAQAREAARVESERKEAAVRQEAQRKEAERLAALKAEAEAREALRRQVEQLALRREAERAAAEREEARRQEAERLAAQAREAARVESERREAAARQEAQRKEAERLAALKAEADAREALRKQVEQLALRREAERAEAERLATLKTEAEALEALRKQVEQLALRREAERAEAERLAAVARDQSALLVARDSAPAAERGLPGDTVAELRREVERLAAERRRDQEIAAAELKELERLIEARKAAIGGEAERIDAAILELDRRQVARLVAQRKREAEARAAAAARPPGVDPGGPVAAAPPR